MPLSAAPTRDVNPHNCIYWDKSDPNSARGSAQNVHRVLLPTGERLDRREPRAVRFRTMKEHFGRRRGNASGSSDPFPDHLFKNPDGGSSHTIEEPLSLFPFINKYRASVETLP